MIVKRRQLTSVFEISGSVIGIFYTFLIASNTGYELASFTMLLLSACLFAGWAIRLNPFGPIVDGIRAVVLRLGELEMFALNRELLALPLANLLQQPRKPLDVLFVHHSPM